MMISRDTFSLSRSSVSGANTTINTTDTTTITAPRHPPCSRPAVAATLQADDDLFPAGGGEDSQAEKQPEGW